MSALENVQPVVSAALTEALLAQATNHTPQKQSSQVTPDASATALSLPVTSEAAIAPPLITDTRENSAPAPNDGSIHSSLDGTPETGLLSGHPDEAAWVAAAAAMAAAQGHQSITTDAASNDLVHADKADAGLTGTELNSYFLAAAASIQQQQQQEQEQAHSQMNGEAAQAAAAVAALPHTQEYDQLQARVQAACQVYNVDQSPFPLGLGKRSVGGMAAFLEEAQAEGDVASVEAKASQLPVSSCDIALGKSRCYWALLSAPVADQGNGVQPVDDLHFVYLDPLLQYHLEDQALPMVGTSFFDYVHPEEKERVSDDMRKIVESRTLFGSVTRCRYSRLPRIREMLGAVNAPRDPEAHKYVEDDNFVAIDIVINWIGDGMALCFFHAIIDKGPEDNDEATKSDWTNWCGTPSGAFNLKQCERMWTQVKATKREDVPLSGPPHVFQVLEVGENGQVLFSWPLPRLFERNAEGALITQSDTTCFNDGSYFADDFARLAQGVSIAPGSSQLSDANTSCTRRFRAKHTLTTEGMVRSIESVLIPYGGVVLACFHTTFQQQLPRADPQLIEEVKTSLEAARGQVRKAEDQPDAPSKRTRESSWNPSDAAQDLLLHSQQQQQQQQSPSPTPSAQTSFNGAAGANGESQWGQNYDGLPLDPNLGSLNSLANASLGYANMNGNGGEARRDRPFDESNPPISGLGGANDPGGSVATLAAVAAAAAAQTKSCTGCGKSNSPEWRRGPTGHKTLCNACGLRYARSLTRRKKKKGKDGEVEFIEPTGDPTVVPKSRGGGGGSLPGVHRKSNKKRKSEDEAKTAAAAAVAVENAMQETDDVKSEIKVEPTSSTHAINISATACIPQAAFDAIYGQFGRLAQHLDQARSLSPDALQAAAQAAVANELAAADQDSSSAPPTV